MDRDGGNGVGDRRWSGAISVTSHLIAQCFTGQRLVRKKRVKLWSVWMDAARWPLEPESSSISVFTLCRRGRRTSLRQYRRRAPACWAWPARRLRVLQYTWKCVTVIILIIVLYKWVMLQTFKVWCRRTGCINWKISSAHLACFWYSYPKTVMQWGDRFKGMTLMWLQLSLFKHKLKQINFQFAFCLSVMKIFSL